MRAALFFRLEPGPNGRGERGGPSDPVRPPVAEGDSGTRAGERPRCGVTGGVAAEVVGAVATKRAPRSRSLTQVALLLRDPPFVLGAIHCSSIAGPSNALSCFRCVTCAPKEAQLLFPWLRLNR